MGASALKLRILDPVTVVTSGTRKALSLTSMLVYAVTIVSVSTNTGTQWVGDELVAVDRGIPIAAGDDVEIETPQMARGVDQFDVSKIYVDSSSNGAVFQIAVWVRE